MSVLSSLRREGLWQFLGNRALKSTLVAGDVGALVLGSIIGHYLGGYADQSTAAGRAWVVALTAVLGMWSIRAQGLLLARNVMSRVVELAKLARACLMLWPLLLLSDRVLHLGMHIKDGAVACLAAFALLVVWRSAFRAWLNEARLRGRYRRRTVLVGGGVELSRLASVITTHRELGMDLVGMISPDGTSSVGECPWLGPVDRAEEIVMVQRITGVVMSSGSIEPERFNALVRNLQASGVNVFLHTGVTGINARRLQPTAMAHEPVFMVEPLKLSRLDASAKRAFDLVVASVLVAVLAPVFVAIAVAVKLSDLGPVFFRQTRVGRHGREFKVMKFRTMHVDAEARLAELAAANERSGPLFKMERDPRVTGVGRWLRASSLDELPQLLNVLKGEMSLVGPRPALPQEVEQFSDEVRNRELVMPGITGLWQVEARDNPSFEAYCRLDQFYVENWNLTLDVLILLGTFEHVVVRLFRSVFTSSGRGSAVDEVLEPVAPHHQLR